MKKALTIILVLVMSVSLCIPAFGATEAVEPASDAGIEETGSTQGSLLSSQATTTYSIYSVELEKDSVTFLDNSGYQPTIKEVKGKIVTGDNVQYVDLVENQDYTQYYTANPETGEAHVYFTGINNYAGSTFIKDYTAQRIDIAGPIALARIGIGPKPYTGQPVEPDIHYAVLTYNPDIHRYDNRLVQDQDWELVGYENNVNCGQATITIRGIGNFMGTLSANFTVSRVALNGYDQIVTIETNDAEYTGDECTPGVNICYNGMTLAEGVDYLTRYSNNTDVGTATIDIAGIGNYYCIGGYSEEYMEEAFGDNPPFGYGSNGMPIDWMTTTFEITPCNLQNANIQLAETQYDYIGTAIKPTITSVTVGNTTLKANKDYTVSYSNNTNIGTGTVTITGIGNYTGTASTEFSIVETDKKNISNATVSVNDVAYTGSPCTPEATVVYDGIKLIKDTDYTVSYKNNINPGTATVTVTGKDAYTGTLSKTFKIKAELSTIQLKYASLTYNGKKRTQSGTTVVTAKINGEEKPLTGNTDYTIEYFDNINVGTATIKVTGNGYYTGSLTATFTIRPASIKKAEVTLSRTTYTYNGKEKKPEVKAVKKGNNIINKSNYTVTYKKNKNAGTALVVITGKKNCRGKIVKEFTIRPKSLEKAVISGVEKKYTIDTSMPGGPAKPKPVVELNGKKLKRGRDYSVMYENNYFTTSNGKVIITGIGNYTGTIYKKFKVKDLGEDDTHFHYEDIPDGAFQAFWDGYLELDPDTVEELYRKYDYSTEELIRMYPGRLMQENHWTIDKLIDEYRKNIGYLPSEVDSHVDYRNPFNVVVTKVVKDGKTLKEGKDYKVTYKRNKKKLTSTYIIDGLGTYKDKLYMSKTVKIDLDVSYWYYTQSEYNNAYNAWMENGGVGNFPSQEDWLAQNGYSFKKWKAQIGVD